jgi:hypothetical protein
VRIDANDDVAARAAYAANPAYGAQIGDSLRAVLDGSSYITFGTVVASPNSATTTARPALPAVGG